MAGITLGPPESSGAVAARAAETDRPTRDAGAKAGQPGAAWMRALRLLTVVAAVILLAVGMADSVAAWKIGRTLSGAAKAAAKVAISTPLDAKNCGGTPCSIQSAAAAAKTYLLSAGDGEAACIDPRNPSFSGVLVWEFSCSPGARTALPNEKVADSSTEARAVAGSANSTPRDACDDAGASVCVKLDMTAAEIQKSGAIIPYTRATVQYPHRSLMALILTPLPERLRPRMPKGVAGSALLRDAF